ncbi:uncharacterized protein LOC122649746 [Telopea speciosissima]|uniref:uncharacterized protein LOC122649746 n=1 Tax=Telopea speciosissima TaxID=54955 RepID=UPI001CC79DD5|nr:uncharacterized protein LOC122649746 [Telopea speciosissima]
MEAQTQFHLRHQIQAITTRHLRSHTTRPSLYSTLSCHYSWPAQSFQNEITFTGLSARLRLPESVALVASSKREVESGLVTETGAEEEEAEINSEEWEKLGYEVYEEGRGDKRCGEKKGIVEVMECLEEEAILGSDQGREPTDYNRRARIFDKSSRVFQALKQRSNAF